MNAWLVLVAILVLCSAAFLSVRRPWRVRCPRAGVEAQVHMDATHPGRGLRGLLRGSVTRAVERAAWVQVVRARYGVPSTP